MALPPASASLLTLVAAFLSTVPELAPAVVLLQDQVQAHQLLGAVGTWQGPPARARSAFASPRS